MLNALTDLHHYKQLLQDARHLLKTAATPAYILQRGDHTRESPCLGTSLCLADV
jgi:hypothetical protein